MATFSTYVFIFSFALLSISIAGRKNLEGKYWRNVIHDNQALSKATDEVLNVDVILPAVSIEENGDCDTMDNQDGKSLELKKHKHFLKDFEPRLNISIYDKDGKLKVGENKSFTKEFEPRPNISAYGDNSDKNGLKEEKKFVDDFEPRPNISIYHD